MRQTSEIEELLPGVPSFSVPSFAERFCILRRKLLLCRQLFHGCVHRKIDVAAISGGQQEINPCASVTESSTFFWHSPWRLDEKKKKKKRKRGKKENRRTGKARNCPRHTYSRCQFLRGRPGNSKLSANACKKKVSARAQEIAKQTYWCINFR